MQEVQLQKLLGKQKFHCDAQVLIEPITKIVTDTCEKKLRRVNLLQEQLRI